jgi:oligopeptide/dipeptide ABC transporter ATP-binding protein
VSAAACELTDVRVALRREPHTLLVDGVSLSASRGEIVGVVGETGAGKTLTMRALLGLLPGAVAATGTVALGDERAALDDVAAVRAWLGLRTSVVLQNPVGMLDPMLRVGRQLVEGVVRREIMREPEARWRARELLAAMGFEDTARVQRLYPHELSGGMAQRIVTAIGMMPRPEVLVLDEPTSALDANVRVEVLRLFRRIAVEEGTAVFLVSHDLGVVSHFCDAVAVMYAGRIVERGSTAQIVGAPSHPYTTALLESSSTLTAERRRPVATIGGAPPRPGQWPHGCVFAPRCPRRAALCDAERPQLVPRHERPVACHYPSAEA